MTKLEILQKLDNCISIIKETDNVYVRKQLEEVSADLIKQWNESDVYYEQIREVLNMDVTYDNLNNIKL